MGFTGELFNTKKFGNNKEDMHGQPGEYLSDISYNLFDLLHILHPQWDISRCDIEVEITKEDVWMIMEDIYVHIINSEFTKPGSRKLKKLEKYFKLYLEVKNLFYDKLSEQDGDSLILKANW